MARERSAPSATGGTPERTPGSARNPVPKSARTRERILLAAAQVLSRTGYAGTRLSDIAAVAGVQAPAMYYYWPSRESLLEEVVTVGQQATMAHVRASLDELPDGTSAMDRIARAVEAHLEVVLGRSDFSQAAIRNAGQLPADIRERQLVGQRAYAEIWRDLVDGAVAAGEMAGDVDARAARMLVLGALNWAPEWWDPARNSLEEVVAIAQQVVRTGLRRAR